MQKGERAIGCRVQVYWEGEDEWFEGVVDAFSTEKGYFVKYDDGEEQWELDAGEYAIQFLTEPDNNGRLISLASDNNKVLVPSESEDEDDYEDDHEEEDNVSEAEGEGLVRPISEKEELVKKSECATTTKQPLPIKHARAFMRTSAAFFRDEETLREMRQDLIQERKTLTNRMHTLTMQLAEKEQVSATLKSELQQLKTSAALANAMHQVPRSTSLTRSPSGALKGSSKPKTLTQWGERVLDQKLENQCLTEDLLMLKTTVQHKQLAVQRKQARRDEMKAKLDRVPRRHLCTLVDLHVEISRLLEEKRALESQSPLPFSRADNKNSASLKTSNVAKGALQTELTSLEVTTERYKQELRQWELKIDCEKARLTPLETRLSSLQQELQQYENSQVLLRSVFLRLGPNSRDGCVSLGAALSAFQTLAPIDRPTLSVEIMKARLEESDICSSTSEVQRLCFPQFVQAFEWLFKS